jgi:hypothetical protein
MYRSARPRPCRSTRSPRGYPESEALILSLPKSLSGEAGNEGRLERVRLREAMLCSNIQGRVGDYPERWCDALTIFTRIATVLAGDAFATLLRRAADAPDDVDKRRNRSGRPSAQLRGRPAR